MTGALPLLLDLDGQPVLERWTSDDEDTASDEEFPELSGPFCSERGDSTFQGLQPPKSSPLPRGMKLRWQWCLGKWPQAQIGIWAGGGQCSQGQVSGWACR